ncbi:MAG TPA: hypothetical protein VMJ65_28205 [Solirubrobacteraceae bacterium]|nr:hypothetical protein [Solirubrobacteraceae bacterium]
MRWRAAAAIALFGIAAIPASSGAVEPIGLPTVHVSVRPASGSSATHFRISFKAPQRTGVVDYRITASNSGHGRCESSISTVAPGALAGGTVHVTLAPTARRGWCAGTFRGQVWNVLIPRCPIGKACPAILPLPRIVGKFTFRVSHG